MDEKTKEEYLLKRKIILETLEKIFDYWDLAKPLYNLVWSQYVKKEVIDALIDIITKSVKDIEDEWKKEKILDALSNLKLIQEKEQKEQEKDRLNAQININNLNI